MTENNCNYCIHYRVCNDNFKNVFICSEFLQKFQCQNCKHYVSIPNSKKGKCLKHIIFMKDNDFCNYYIN